MKYLLTLISVLFLLVGNGGCRKDMHARGTGIRERDKWYGNPSKHHRYPVQRYHKKQKTLPVKFGE